jgi:benzodiazapine receptor
MAGVRSSYPHTAHCTKGLTDMTARSLVRLALCLALCLGVGFVAGIVTTPEIPTWYASLQKPSWTPPNWAFPVVWSILYALMGVSLWLLWDRPDNPIAARKAIALFFVQLALNFAWSPVFFWLHRPVEALFIIALLVVILAVTIACALKAQRTAGLLLVPYLIWVTYATTLNAGIVALNPSV